MSTPPSTGPSDYVSAYVQLKIVPPWSPEVARELSNDPGILYAATVWGEWDVILKVAAESNSDFYRILDRVREDRPSIRRTQTILVRSDQIAMDEHEEPQGSGFAFLFLRLNALATDVFLRRIAQAAREQRAMARPQYVAGTLGDSDAVCMLTFNALTELEHYVISYLQSLQQTELPGAIPSVREWIAETVTVLGIERYIRGTKM